MLAKSETVTRLIFDERWGGADAVSILDETYCYIKQSGNIEYHTTSESVTELDPLRMRNCLSGNERKHLNRPDLSEKEKRRRVEKPKSAHAGRQKRLRSGRQKSVPDKRRRQLLRPRLLQSAELLQPLSVVVLGE